MWFNVTRRLFAPCVVACGLAATGCGSKSDREATLERELARERVLHTRDVQDLQESLTESEGRYLRFQLEQQASISRVVVLEDQVRRLDRALGTVPLSHWVDLLSASDPEWQELAARQLLVTTDLDRLAVEALLDLATRRADLRGEIVEGLGKALPRISSLISEVAVRDGPASDVAREVARKAK